MTSTFHAVLNVDSPRHLGIYMAIYHSNAVAVQQNEEAYVRNDSLLTVLRLSQLQSPVVLKQFPIFHIEDTLQ